MTILLLGGLFAALVFTKSPGARKVIWAAIILVIAYALAKPRNTK